MPSLQKWSSLSRRSLWPQQEKQFCISFRSWSQAREKKTSAPGPTGKKDHLFQIVLPAAEKQNSAVSGRQQNHHLFQNRVPAAEKKKFCTFFIRSLQKSAFFPCIPMYFQIFSVKITGGPGPSLSELLPGWHEKKFCFFRNHHLFQNALLGRNKKKFCRRSHPQKTPSLSDRHSGEK